MQANIKFAKVRPDAIIPTKNDEDVGFDLYACFDDNYICIPPHETKLIPTGIASAFSKEWGLIIEERSSVGSKGIAKRAGVIDSGYRGEIHVAWTNTTDRYLFITKLTDADTVQNYYMKNRHTLSIKHLQNALCYPYKKAIAQGTIIPVPNLNIEEIPYEELKQIESIRGEGGFGSTNK